eukprot:g21319.t1
MAGQLEAVQMLLEAGVDPHVKRSMPEGEDPKEGETSRELAEKMLGLSGLGAFFLLSGTSAGHWKRHFWERTERLRHGWDDIAAALKEAEKSFPRGLYKEFGRNNNAKLWPIDRPEGLDPEQEQRAKAAYKKMSRPLPRKETCAADEVCSSHQRRVRCAFFDGAVIGRPVNGRQEDRLFYGDLVFGVNFGTDAKGRPIKVKKPIAPAENGAVADGQE